VTRVRSIVAHGQMVRQYRHADSDPWRLLRIVKAGEDEISADSVALRALCDAEGRHQDMRADVRKFFTWGLSVNKWAPIDGEMLVSTTCARCGGDVSFVVLVDEPETVTYTSATARGE
jgi:hypothetical protein